ncbi:TonB-dependent receptor [Marinimicrobium agarilyticum]|uniref:TonB-dependent receptor n=1 Tax=Marinimicrobium agarilyticum TaxID=306546 RepID=UPI0004261E51|nr:TonB-dependent receptor [Marinimicrobium agarilyticum]
MIYRAGFSPTKTALALAIGCALGSTSVIAQDQATTETEADLLEEIIVKGVRQSQAKAIDIKRDSDRIVDSIVAEDIGRMPDTTITDSLQRVTGVQITREANEGTSLNIRGMPQVLTTLNGEQFLSPWSITSVGANYSDIPASMIGGVDVYKSQSAQMVAGGISGVVDLKTLAPLSMEDGITSNVRYEASQGDRSKDETNADGSTSTRDPDYNASVFFGYNHDDVFAFNLSGFSSETYNANYSMYENPQFGFLDQQNGTPTDPLDFDGDGDLVNDWYLVPQNYGVSSSFVTREREGGSFSAEWNINDNFTVRGDAFYTRMDQYNRGVQVQFNGKDAVSSFQENGKPGTEPGLFNTLQEGSIFSRGGDFTFFDADGVEQTRTLHSLRVAEVSAPDFQTRSSNQINKTAALNTNLQLDYTNNDNLDVSVRFVHAEAERRYRDAVLQQGSPAWLWVDVDDIPGKDPVKPYDLTVDYRGEFPSFSFDRDVSDANLLEMYQAIATGSNTDASLNVGRVDVNFQTDTGILRSVDFGVRYGVRDADYTDFAYVTPTQRYANDQRIPIEKRNQLYSGNRIWQQYPDWRRFNYEDEEQALIDAGLYNNGFSAGNTVVFNDFGPFSGFENGVSALDPQAWDNPLDFMNRLYPGTRTVEDPAYAYNVEEASTEAYVQFNFESDEGLWGIPYSGNVGLKALQTDRTVIRNSVPEVLDVFNSIGALDHQRLAFVYDPVTMERSFTQYLPSLNMNLFPTDDTVVRFAAARTTSRNDLQNVGSGLSLWYTDCEKTDENGERVLYLNSEGEMVGDVVSCVGGGTDNGNIDIDPWEADVYNTSAEWYFDENAILGVGLFFIDVGTSVESYQERRSFVDGDGVDRGNTANVWVSDNAEASSLYGLEFGYKQPFTFLPGDFLSSTGMEFNYTYSQSDSEDEDLEGNTLPLPSNSEHQSNLILWYDKDGLNVRAAYNWRSEEYTGRAGLSTSGEPVNLANWAEPIGYLDMSVNYWINEHFSVYLNGTNLTEESRRVYAQYEHQLQNIWVQERRYTLGVTVSF